MKKKIVENSLRNHLPTVNLLKFVNCPRIGISLYTGDTCKIDILHIFFFFLFIGWLTGGAVHKEASAFKKRNKTKI